MHLDDIESILGIKAVRNWSTLNRSDSLPSCNGMPVPMTWHLDLRCRGLSRSAVTPIDRDVPPGRTRRRQAFKRNAVCCSPKDCQRANRREDDSQPRSPRPAGRGLSDPLHGRVARRAGASQGRGEAVARPPVHAVAARLRAAGTRPGLIRCSCSVVRSNACAQNAVNGRTFAGSNVIQPRVSKYASASGWPGIARCSDCTRQSSIAPPRAV